MDDVYDDLWADEEVEVPEPFNAMELAKYFRNRYDKAPWQYGFGVINMVAFAAQIKRWKKNQTPDTIKALMDAYMDDVSLRGKNPGWQDFIYRANMIAATLKARQTNEWDDYQKEWENTHGIEL